MADTRRSGAAVSLLYGALVILCCGCHQQLARSERVEPLSAETAPAVESRSHYRTGIQLASATETAFGTGSEIAENLRRGHSEFTAGRPAQAARFYERVLRDDPDHVVAHHRLAVIADLSQDFAESERHYRAALLARPTDVALLNDLGYSYFLQKRFEESEQVLREAISIAGPTERSVANLALLYTTLGDDRRAIDVLGMTARDRASAESQHQRLIAIRERDGSPSQASCATDQIILANASCDPRGTLLPAIRPAQSSDTSVRDVPAAPEGVQTFAVPQGLPLWSPTPETSAAFSTPTAPVEASGRAASYLPAKNSPLPLPPAYFDERSPTVNAARAVPAGSPTATSGRADVITMIGHSRSIH